MIDDYIRETLKAYDANPGQYEEATRDLVPMRELERLIGVLPNRELPVLDAGCGFGRDTALFDSKGLKVVGIDMSRELLVRARQLYPSLDFREMDVRQLDFDDESFSGIWCNSVLLHLNDEDVSRALDEFRRVLVSGGVLFISFKKGTGDEMKHEKLSSDGARYYKYQTAQSVTELVEKSGLTVMEVYEVNELERWGLERALDLVYCFAKKE